MFDASMAHHPTTRFDFTMCNPPFYSDEAEKRDAKSNKLTGASQNVPMLDNEKMTEGGEVAFVREMMQQSRRYKDRCDWFTTMIGIKSNFQLLLREVKQLPVFLSSSPERRQGSSELKKKGVKQVKESTLFQGQTVRWVMAWTFIDPSYEGTFALKTPLGAEILQLHAQQHGLTLTKMSTEGIWHGKAPGFACHLISSETTLRVRGSAVSDIKAWSQWCSALKKLSGA